MILAVADQRSGTGHALCPPGSGLPDDTVGSIVRQAEKLGGSVHLAAVDELAGDELRLRILRIERRSTPITDLGDRPGGQVGEETTLGALVQGMNVGEQVAFCTYESETVITLVADSIQPVPSAQPDHPAAAS